MSTLRIVYPLLPALGLLVGIALTATGADHTTAAALTQTMAGLPRCSFRELTPCHERSAAATSPGSPISGTLYLPLISRLVPAPYQLVARASADATLVQGMPATNFGYTNSIRAGYDDRESAEALSSDAIMRGLVRFDLAGLPTGSRVTTATLRLYLFESYDYDGQFRTITTYRPTADWDEGGVTWESAPGYAESYGSQSIQHTDDAVGWFDFDVTPLVQAWVDGSQPDYGIMVRGPEESGSNSAWRGFISRDFFPDAAYAPQLVVEYLSTIPPGESTLSAPKRENSGTAPSLRHGPAPVVPGSVLGSKSLRAGRPER